MWKHFLSLKLVFYDMLTLKEVISIWFITVHMLIFQWERCVLVCCVLFHFSPLTLIRVASTSMSRELLNKIVHTPWQTLPAVASQDEMMHHWNLSSMMESYKTQSSANSVQVSLAAVYLWVQRLCVLEDSVSVLSIFSFLRSSCPSLLVFSGP